MSDPGLGAWPYPARIGHRGAGRLAPENTLAGLRTGWEFGYRMFEFDAKLSVDGVVVLIHDDSLERTTNGHGPVAGHSFEDLRRLDAGAWHSPAMAGEPIPALAEAAEWLVGRGGLANIEIKPCLGREAETGVAVALRATECWAGVSPPPLLSSFSEEALDAARLSAPDLPRGLLLDRLPSNWVARAQALGCVAVHLHAPLLDRAVVRRAHGAGLRVLVYTVNDPERASVLSDWGVDGLITDALDRIPAGT